ncbi:hypothetical protein [Streptosporangium minutum]|uniref:Lipoprotein n=1 Tax=Streptosporangium minutum TaxID=569862 RepID=A0A243QGL5_9ACTN|nr:hypothetical protein [Streptosporangium minutum]OUC81236.1 hypothetical protein CA984_41910 [Streptosporangium minutum]
MTAAAIVSLAALAACGQAGNDGAASVTGMATSASPATSPQADGLKYARCMRENGVDMPDPEPGGGAVVIRGKINRNKLDRAAGACDKYSPTGPEKKTVTDPEFQDAFLGFARCMRENGVDVPDPDFSDGKVHFGGNGMELGTPQSRKAMQACREQLPGAGKRP